MTDTSRSSPTNKILTTPIFHNKIHKCKKHFNYSFSYDGPTLWNTLPLSVRTASSLYSFRRGLKAYLFTLAFPP